MHYRRLGRSGLKVSEISLGAWVTFGSQLQEQSAVNLVHAAYDQGINFFDNADMYADGLAETVMGKPCRTSPPGTGHLKQGILPHLSGTKRERPVTQAHHQLGPCNPQTAGYRLSRPVFLPPLRSRYPHGRGRQNHDRPGQPGQDHVLGHLQMERQRRSPARLRSPGNSTASLPRWSSAVTTCWTAALWKST